MRVLNFNNRKVYFMWRINQARLSSHVCHLSIGHPNIELWFGLYENIPIVTQDELIVAAVYTKQSDCL